MSSSPYSAIAVIFNPKSTRSSQTNAQELRTKLHQTLPDVPVTIIPTERAGHARHLAYELAKSSSNPLIISASGDGGYNEVINGVMQAQAEGATVTTGLLPSGNANDHYKSLRATGKVEERILHGKPRSIDLICVTATHQGQQWQRYAHSYVGIGITANVGIKLNKMDLNPVNEWVVTARTIYNSPPTTILVNGKKHRYDSLIFSNISRLAKVFVLSSNSKIDDGKFEVIGLQSKNKAEMLSRVARALTNPADNVADVTSVEDFTFQTIDSQAMQLDGEIVSLEPETTVEIRSVPQTLRCVI
jgi:diacylglycerol kinase (ATP)